LAALSSSGWLLVIWGEQNILSKHSGKESSKSVHYSQVLSYRELEILLLRNTKFQVCFLSNDHVAGFPLGRSNIFGYVLTVQLKLHLEILTMETATTAPVEESFYI
jgi:hypothetical protein